MTDQTMLLVQLLKAKRDREGYSIRQLSSMVGVSFSTLARIERGGGEPDNNTKIRILEWLGEDARQAGLQFNSVALVHFRARKNVDSQTIQALLSVANHLKQDHQSSTADTVLQGSSGEDAELVISLTKDEMEGMAEKLRKDLGLRDTDPLEPFRLKIEGVELMGLADMPGIDQQVKQDLLNSGKQAWSAMSVPMEEKTDRWSIVWNTSQSRKRQRVSLLEEIWHILLGHKLTRITKVADVFGRTFAEAEEHDAYYLASATLLPANVIKTLVEKQQAIADVARMYGTTQELVEYRIKRLGLWRQYKGLKVELTPEES